MISFNRRTRVEQRLEADFKLISQFESMRQEISATANRQTSSSNEITAQSQSSGSSTELWQSIFSQFHLPDSPLWFARLPSTSADVTRLANWLNTLSSLNIDVGNTVKAQLLVSATNCEVAAQNIVCGTASNVLKLSDDVHEQRCAGLFAAGQ